MSAAPDTKYQVRAYSGYSDVVTELGKVWIVWQESCRWKYKLGHNAIQDISSLGNFSDNVQWLADISDPLLSTSYIRGFERADQYSQVNNQHSKDLSIWINVWFDFPNISIFDWINQLETLFKRIPVDYCGSISSRSVVGERHNQTTIVSYQYLLEIPRGFNLILD